jgi:hypothetical protein
VVDALEHLGEHRLDLEQALVAARPRLRDLEDPRLGLVQELPDLLPPGLSASSAMPVATCARRRCTARSRTSSA